MNKELMVYPFTFRRLPNRTMLLVNQGGEHLFLKTDEFEQLLQPLNEMETTLSQQLQAKYFIGSTHNDFAAQLAAVQLRSRKAFLRDFSSLHMIVVTGRCNFKCTYCHASSSNIEKTSTDMKWDVAKKTVETIFSSPSPVLKIEFQGGEPLLNWPIIKDVVEYAKVLNRYNKRQLEFVICTNLTLINHDILTFCKKHNIMISTSLDGPKEIHDSQRISRNGKDSYATFLEKLNLTRLVLGEDACSPLLTITKKNLHSLREIIDHYISLGFHGVFLRALNPYGFAKENMETLGYSVEEFTDAYIDALNYIIELNLQGTHFVEYYSLLLLQRILTPFSTGFVDLQSPSGAAISGVIYDYNGEVYVSDEARMIARMGDKKFLMGNVMKDSYETIFTSQIVHDIVNASCVETLPKCSQCAFHLYCGADPVRAYWESKQLYNKVNSDFCKKNTAIFEYLFKLLQSCSQDVHDLFWAWLTQRDLGGLRSVNANR